MDEDDESKRIAVSRDSGGRVYRIHYDWGAEPSLSTTLVKALTEIADRREDVELERLYDNVDPDALDTLFRPTRGESQREGAFLSFVFGDFDVTVHGDGEIVVRPRPNP